MSDLREHLASWRAERPDEWTMDEFIRKALTLQSANDELEAKYAQACADKGESEESFSILRDKAKELEARVKDLESIVEPMDRWCRGMEGVSVREFASVVK